MKLKVKNVVDINIDQVQDGSGNNVTIQYLDIVNVQLRDDNGTLVSYLDNIVSGLSWEWLRIGGCGICSFTLRTNFDSEIAGNLKEDYEIRIYVSDYQGISSLWYSGYIDRVSPSVDGKEERIDVSCLGYINQLKRIIVENKVYSLQELSVIAKDVLDSYVAPNTKVTSAQTDYDDSYFVADELYFNESAYDVISKLADIAGKKEWGVKADKSFFFKRRNDSITKYFFIDKDFISFTPIKDFNPIITKIYLEGGENYKGIFTVTNRIALREEIVSNSSILTQSVGQQFARVYLKDKSRPYRSYVGVVPDQEYQLESTCPLGRAAINLKMGVNYLYDVATQLYDSGLKYDGGTEAYQIEKIKYTLLDEKVYMQLYFGPLPPTIADNFKQLEYYINNERNK